jgi:hypothetical protein
MSGTGPIVPLLVFEAADCLMAVPASEVAHLEGSKRGREGLSEAPAQTPPPPLFDLGEYFGGRESDGPWLRWARGTRSAWLRVRRVIDVVPVSLSGLTPMPTLLRGQRRTRAFLAAGVRDDDVFLLLDPARLGADALKVTTLEHPSAGRDISRAHGA